MKRGKGKYITEKGYVRHSAGILRGEYEHRVIMFRMTMEFSYYGPGLPEGFTVEHIDHNKQHNCPGNLLLLESVIHNHISWCSWKGKR